jgi:hypothetical protein
MVLTAPVPLQETAEKISTRAKAIIRLRWREKKLKRPPFSQHYSQDRTQAIGS